MAAGAGKSAGRVSVRVVPDSSKFGAELKAELDKIERGARVEVKAEFNDTALNASLDKLRATDVQIDVQANTANVRRQVESVGRSGGKVEIPVSLSGANIVRAELIRVATNRVIELVVNVNKRSLAAAGSALASLSGGKSAVGYLQNIGSALSGLDKSVPKISAVALGIGSIGAAGFASVGGALSLASSLAAVAGAGIAVPGILAGIGLAGGTLAVALSSAKTELAGLAPTLQSFQKSIGGAFFAQAKAPITDLVTAVTGKLGPAFEGLSGSLGRFAGALAKSLSSAPALAAIGSIIASTKGGIDAARGAIAPLIAAFSTLGTIGASYLPALGEGLTDIATKFNIFVTAAAADGSLQGWISTGIAGLKSLGSVVGSVAGIVNGLFTAANAATGGNGLAVFADALKQVSTAVNSSGLQTALTTIFTGANAGAAGLAAAIRPIGSLLGALAPTLAGVFRTAGTVVGGALSAIASALESPAFATGLTAFFSGIAAGVAAVLPVLPAIVGALGTIASTAGLVAAQLGPVLAASFAALAPVVSQVLTSLQPLIPIIGAALASSVSILAVALTALAPLFSTIITAVAPLVPLLAGALAGAIQTLAPALGTIVTALLPAVAAIVTALLPIVSQIVVALAAVLPAILTLIPPLLQIVTAILPLIPQVMALVVPLVMQLVPIIAQALAAILPLVPSLLQLVVAGLQLAAAIQGPIFAAFGAFVGILPTLVAGLQAVLGFVTAFVQGALALFTGNFSAIPGIIASIFGRVGQIFASGLAGPAGLLQSFVSNGIARIGQFGSSIVSTISSAMSSFTSKISSAISQAVNTIASLPGKARSALGNIGGLFVSVGGDIIRGIISGIGSAVGQLVSAIVSAVKSGLSAAKGALGINSPSRVFRDEVGVMIPRGVEAGVSKGMPSLNRTISGMVNPNTASLAAARIAAPSVGAAGAAAGNVYQFGDVVGHSISALVDEIERRQALRDYAASAAGWG